MNMVDTLVRAPLVWHGCYDDAWKGHIVPDAFSHPAKFSRGLIARIVEFGLAQGWWKPGDLIGDPFGGVACGGIVCGFHALNWIGVELEERFVGFGNQNIELNRSKWRKMGMDSDVRLIKGDSRRFASIVGEITGIIASPPYAETGVANKDRRDWNHRLAQLQRAKDRGEKIGPEFERILKRGLNPASNLRITGYGKTEGQIGDLPEGAINSILTSPPFLGARSDTTSTSSGIQIDGYNGKGRKDDVGSRTFLAGKSDARSDGNIESMPPGELNAIITSPPYANINPEKNSSGIDMRKNWESYKANGGGQSFEGYCANQKKHSQGYGSSDGQIASTGDSETYWNAMATVYGQCLLALPSGGRLVVVMKDYVKAKARVPLCDQTCKLLEHVGFTIDLRIHAMLTKETRSAGLFHDHIEKKSRKSFFRRLAESKGSPAIDYEEVIVAIKPGGGE